jgi:hypothetical protein
MTNRKLRLRIVNGNTTLHRLVTRAGVIAVIDDAKQNILGCAELWVLTSSAVEHGGIACDRK